MIVDLQKYLVFGAKNDMDQFFALAQKGGFLEFIGPSRRKALELPPAAKTFLAAIKIAKHYPTHPYEVPASPLTIFQVAESIVEMKKTLEALQEEERILVAEIARIAIFGDFSRQEMNEIEVESHRVFQFFCMKSSLASKMAPNPELIYIGTEYDLDYFVSIAHEKVQYPKMIEIVIDRPVGTLRNRLFELREEIAKIETDLRSFANTLPELQSGLLDVLDQHHLKMAKHNVTWDLNQNLFAIEAWVPKNRIEALHNLCTHLNVECEEISIETKDRVPTCIENKGAGKVGEDLVLIFDTPSHTDKDPSLWVLIFFSLFFAMIASDAGYGFLFLLATLCIKWKFPDLRGTAKRLVKLSLIVSVATILWGVATASYFGLSFSPRNPIQKTSFLGYLSKKKADYHLAQKDDVYEEALKTYPAIKEAKSGEDLLLAAKKEEKRGVSYPLFEEFSNNVLLEISLLVGILHISLSFLRYLLRNWAGLGWILFMVGGYLYFPSLIHATVIVNFLQWISKPAAEQIGFQILFGGLGIALLAALIQKGWRALQELFHGVQVFADVLSYLRLYALAFGGMVMAHTFNDAIGFNPGIFLTVMIILGGHAINIALCLMGGVVHGLRLNFLEWFHYSFEGNGRLFNPLKIHKK